MFKFWLKFCAGMGLSALSIYALNYFHPPRVYVGYAVIFFAALYLLTFIKIDVKVGPPPGDNS